MSLEADFLLLDDRAARELARDLELPLLGTLALLDLGARRGYLHLPSALVRLAKTNFRASPELLRRLLR
jgi:predicted nucleic acid-binding protein